LKIVVAGYIVGYPLGGMTWHHLNYLFGLAAMGHQVTYLEDGAHLPPFDPTTGDSGDATYGLRYLRETLSHYGYDQLPWHYRFGDVVAGLSIDEINRTLREADLLICVSGVTPLDWYDRPARSLVIDTDPVFTQLRMRHDESFLSYYRSFTHVATFGRLIGTEDSPLPTHGIKWIATNQPVMMRYWPALPSHSGYFTTLGKWEHAADRGVEFNGQRFGSTKATEWMKLINLPAHTEWQLRMAMADLPPDVRIRFEDAGWLFDDPIEASRDTRAFRNFVAASAGELTVAKQIYAGVPNGWFSDRSACFLMCGRPVVTQASGFTKWLPTGEGLFSFTSMDEAAAALEKIRADHPAHCAAARRIAEEFFDSELVLTELLERVA
jgi:hypothetical protein